MHKDIIKRPIITERSIKKTKKGFYTFAVLRNTRKEEIKKAIENQFNVNILSVRTIKMSGKKRRVGKLMKIKKAQPWKKAVVKLKKDQKIPIFEVGT